MKNKASRLLLSMAIILCFQSSTVFAETPLSQLVNDSIGVAYKWGGTTKEGFDCSGFTQYAFQQWGVKLPHTSGGQAELGTKVAKDDLQRGDLVFFNTNGKGISHVGIYLGNNEFIHSASNKGITINNLSENYYANRYITARRVLDNQTFSFILTDPNEQNTQGAVTSLATVK